MIKINEFLLIDHDFDSPEQYENWNPDDLYDYHEWIKVLVGTDKYEGGSWFQVHVCSDDALSLRTKVKVNAQWKLFCLIQNIEKIKNYDKLAA